MSKDESPHRDTGTEPCADRGRDWNGALLAKGCAKDGLCHQQLGSVEEGFPRMFYSESDPLGTLILDFYPPELGGNTKSIVLSHRGCGTSLGQALLEDEPILKGSVAS